MSDSRPASSIAAVTFVPRTTSTSAPLDANRLGQRVVLQVRLVDDLAAGGLQALDAALLELVGDRTFIGQLAADGDRESDSCTSSPSRSLGSNQVDLGGMMPAAVRDRHQVLDGHRVHRERHRRLAGIDRLLAAPRCRARRRRSRSACRCACRRCGASARARAVCSSATSRPAAARRVLRRGGREIDGVPAAERDTSTPPLPRGAGVPSRDRHAGASAARNSAGVAPARSFTVRL